MAYLIAGFILFFIGAVLTFTGIGACIGIPLVIVGFVFWIVGAVKYRQATMEQLKKSIRDGIVEGAQEIKSLQETVCPKCGAKMPIDAKFCPSCGRPNVPSTG